MEHIPVILSPDQLFEIQSLIRFRKDFSAEAPFCQEYDDFLTYLSDTLEKAENEYLANSYCVDDDESSWVNLNEEAPE